MLVKKPSSFQNALSYVIPIKLAKKRDVSGKKLVVQLYRGQYQLTYGRVFYSDGFDYFPIKNSLLEIGLDKFRDGASFLSLGSGLGSLTMVLNHLAIDKKFSVDYVDINRDIIDLCENITKDAYPNIQHNYHCADANYWLRDNNKTYDCIVVDIFEEHVVPIFVFKKPFISQLKNALNESGYVILNMMFHSEFQQHEFEIKFSEMFKDFIQIKTRKNKIYIAQK